MTDIRKNARSLRLLFATVVNRVLMVIKSGPCANQIRENERKTKANRLDAGRHHLA